MILSLAWLWLAACGEEAEEMMPAADASVEEDADRPDSNMPDAAPDEPEDAAVDAVPEPDPPTPCDGDELPTCLDPSTRVACVEGEGGPVLAETACAEGLECLLGACATEVQQQTADQIRAYIADVRARSGHPYPADYAALEEEALRTMLAVDDPQEGLIRGAIRFQRSLRHGHQALLFGQDGELCGPTTGLPYQAQTFYAGLCGVPSGDGVLVMSAPEGNALGLQPGDVVVATDTWPAGPTFLDDVAAAPACNTRQGASEDSDRVEAAATFFGKIDEGTTLTVRAPDGAERTVEVPARETGIEPGQEFCLNPFGGYSFVEAELTVREDGVAVIRNSTLLPEPWMDDETYLIEVQAMIDRIAAVIATVPEGAPIIWDVRGNSGGSAEVGLGVVAGMAGARSVEISRGFVRIADTDPPEWEAEPLAFQSYSMEIGDDLGTNHREHPVAVLIDGKTVSAADIFAYAAAEFTDALIVGPEVTSGSFGFGGGRYRLIEGPMIPMYHRVDPLRVETPDGEFLERQGVVPDLVVPYDPSDVAAGIDTVLEAAAAALLAAQAPDDPQDPADPQAP